MPDPPRPTLAAGFIVYAGDDTPKGRAEARAWLRAKEMGPEDVEGRIIDGSYCLILRRAVHVPP